MHEFRLHHVTRHKTYTDGKASSKTIVALDDVTTDILPGCVTCILGASGSGKTVMLRHIIGLLRSDSGRILIDGTDITDFSEEQLRDVRKKIATLFQGGALVPEPERLIVDRLEPDHDGLAARPFHQAEQVPVAGGLDPHLGGPPAPGLSVGEDHFAPGLHP